MWRTVHPHVRGDNENVAMLLTVRERFTPTCVGTIPLGIVPRLNVVGSPPRAWGQCCAGRGIASNQIRFTPTCVGTMLA